MKIKIITSSIIFLLCINAISAQNFKFGGKFSIGIGGMNNCGSIQDYYNFKMANDKDITVFDFNYNSGTSIKLGGIVSYQINDMIALNGGLEFQKTSNKIDLHRVKTTNKDGSFKDNQSTTKISISGLNFPVTVKARFGGNVYKPFVEGGFSLEARMGKSIESKELKTKYDASNGQSSLTNYAFKNMPLEGLSSTALNYIIGGGVDYEINEKITVFVNMSYIANIGKGELWSKSINPNSVGNTNKIFDLSEQADIKTNGFIIDDWKSSLFSISFGVMF